MSFLFSFLMHGLPPPPPPIICELPHLRCKFIKEHAIKKITLIHKGIAQRCFTFYKIVAYKNVKRIVKKMHSPSGQPRWVWFFIGADLKKCSIASLACQWMLCSEWVPSESKQLIKHHNNPQHFSSSINVL